MTAESDPIDVAFTCEECGGPLPAKRYVYADGLLLWTLCSTDCVRVLAREESWQRWTGRWRAFVRLLILAVFATSYLTPHQGPLAHRPIRRAMAKQAVRPVEAPAPLPPGVFGPDWPPNDVSALVKLGGDAWLHPLPGPVRRMPRSDSRVFGAERPGNRPIECRNGHCGVDLGGEMWGEYVHAVHDGIVDWVKRGPNAERGGKFVRISHRDGTVFSQYFHLAGIPRGIERGVHVKGGQLIGLLGDTGVKDSVAHLHFTISMRPGKDWPERYVDPEPLVSLWPLRVPIDGGPTGLVSTVALVGLPHGSIPLLPGHKAKLAKQELAARKPAKRGAAASGAPNASEDTGGGGARTETEAETETAPAAETVAPAATED
jgi:murein DD-endopeptidase MepM/ murein hydrolase activator NlpD